METTIFTIDGKDYKMFSLEVCGEYMNIASYDLDEKIYDMMTDTPSRYHEVKHIDELYGFSIDENIRETEHDIREHIKDIIYGDVIDNHRIIMK